MREPRVQITLPLAVEKVLFRLALLEEGTVSLARAFLELPLSLEEVEQYAEAATSGLAMVKNSWGEFLCYEFPELMRQMPASVPTDCPVCAGPGPSVVTEGGVEARRAVLCDACFRRVRHLCEKEPDQRMVERLRSFFRGGEEEDPRKVAAAEHELFFHGLRLGVEQFTSTSVAAQSRIPASQVKEHLDRMGARRYIQLGLLPSGDAVAYSFPPGLTYPQVHYRRLEGPVERWRDVGRPAAPRPQPQPQPRVANVRPVVRPRTPPLNITIRKRSDPPVR